MLVGVGIGASSLMNQVNAGEEEYIEDDGITFDRFWVGGTDTWNGTAGSKWATTSGGAGGASVPTAAHNVIFDENSGSGTVTLASGAVVKHLSFNGFAGTISHSSGFNMPISGGLTLTSDNTYNKVNATSSAFTFNATSGSWKIRTGGKSLGNLTWSGVGGTWDIDSDLTTAGSINHTGGTVNWNTHSHTITSMSFGGSSVRVMNLGGSTFNASGNWTTNVTTNATLNAGTSRIVISATSLNTAFNLYNVEQAGTFLLLTGAVTYNSIRSVNPNDTQWTLSPQSNITVTGDITVKGYSNAKRTLFAGVTGSPIVITHSATHDIQDADIMDLEISGTAWNLSSRRVGNCGGTTNITFPTQRTLYYVGNTGTYSDATKWATASGGSTNPTHGPLVHDITVFDENSFTSGSQTLTVDMPSVPGLDFTNVENNPTLARSGATNVFGDMIMKSGMTHTGSSVGLAGRGNYTFQQDGTTWPAGVGFSQTAPGAVYTVVGDVSVQDIITVSAGTFDANDNNVTCSRVTISGALTRVVRFGNGTWTMTGTGNVVSITGSNYTIDEEGSLLDFTNTTSSTKTFAGASNTFNNIRVRGASGGGTFTFTGGNTFNDCTFDPNANIRFTASTTTTFTGTINWVGTAGNLITINSATAANHTLSKSAGTVSAEYLSLTRSQATGGATWNATNTTNGGNNSGWNIS